MILNAITIHCYLIKCNRFNKEVVIDLASCFSSLFKKKVVEAKTETNDKPLVSNSLHKVGRNKTHIRTGNIKDAKVKAKQGTMIALTYSIIVTSLKVLHRIRRYVY